jgi:hypothetical protein
MAGPPYRLVGIVYRSARYIWYGSDVREPNGNATNGVVGETSTSTRSNAVAKSRVISVRTFCACP